jgi:hypothetical protein
VKNRQWPFPLLIVVSTLGLLSKVDHKETRFTTPVVCMSCSIIGYVLALHSKNFFKYIVRLLVLLIAYNEIVTFQKFAAQEPGYNCYDVG